VFLFLFSAKQRLQGISCWHLVDKIHSIDQLGWYRKTTSKYLTSSIKRKTTDTYYPCRKFYPDETMGIFDKVPTNQLAVRYLTLNQKTEYKLIAQGRWEGLGEDGDNTKMTNYMAFLKTKVSFSDDPVALKLEELAIRAMWDKAKENEAQHKKQPQATTAAQEPACQAAQLVLPGMPVAKEISGASTMETYPMSSQDITNNAPDDASSPSSDSDSEDGLQSPGKKKETLRNGDVIEYYDPIGVAGKPEWLRHATIVGIDPKQKNLPLNLDNGQSIDRDHPIKRIQIRHRGKIQDYSGTFKAVRHYALRTCGTQELIGIQSMARQAKEIRQRHEQGVASFWEGGNDEEKGEKPQNEDMKNARKPEKTTGKPSAPKDQVQKPSSSDKLPRPWEKHLSALLKATREKMEQNHRFVPSMTPERLELVLKVWSRLEIRMQQQPQTTSKMAVQDLAETLDLSLYRVDIVMHGDEAKKLSYINKEEVLQALKKWMNKEPLPKHPPSQENDSVVPQEIAFSTPGQKRKLAAAEATNRRKRQKQEVAQSLNKWLSDASSSNHSSNIVLNGSTVVSATPSGRRSCVGGSRSQAAAMRTSMSQTSNQEEEIKLASSRQKRRLSQATTVDRVEFSATLETTSKVVARESVFRNVSTGTPAQKKPAQATNRRKSQKQDVAQSLNKWLGDASSSNHSSNIVPNGSTVVSVTPSGRRSNVGGSRSQAAAMRTSMSQTSNQEEEIKVASSRQKRRISQATTTDGMEFSATLETPSKVVARESVFRDVSTGTPTQKRPARPAFEPPSVTRRKKRQSNLLSQSMTTDSGDTMPRKKRRQSVASESKEEKKVVDCPIEMARKDIGSLIEIVRNKMETRRRYRPHMTIEHLEFMLKVWAKVSVMAKTMDGVKAVHDVAKILTDMANELGVSHKKLTRCLKGDKEKYVGQNDIEDISGRLNAWLVAKEAASEEVKDAEAMNATGDSTCYENGSNGNVTADGEESQAK
jgi:hypothetical protein